MEEAWRDQEGIARYSSWNSSQKMQRINKLYVGLLWLHVLSRPCCGEHGRDGMNFTPWPMYQGSAGWNDHNLISIAGTGQHSSGAQQPCPFSQQSVNKEPEEAEQIREWLSVSHGYYLCFSPSQLPRVNPLIRYPTANSNPRCPATWCQVKSCFLSIKLSWTWPEIKESGV